ncbi:MAG: DUF2244 domain-containing protein [Pseudomonadota bacterium]
MPPTDQIIYFDATLSPNRSLSPRAFVIVMTIVGCVSFVAGLLFVSQGAFPVIGFFGLDALAIWYALRWNARQLKQETRIRVTAETVDMEHLVPGKPAKRASVPTPFARVGLAYPERSPSVLSISHGAASWAIGAYLTGDERRSLAAALEAAIQRARAERYA